jgi:hypothetical protein
MEDMVPLSEEELRLLEQMERAIVEEDPKFASALRGATLERVQKRHAVLAGIGVVGGVAVLMTGVVTGIWPIGVLGFLVMLGTAMVGVEALRGRTRPLSLTAARRWWARPSGRPRSSRDVV